MTPRAPSGRRRVVVVVVAMSALLSVGARARSAPDAVLHIVEMTSRGGPRFEPAETSARPGDTVRFVNVRGGPHNVQFFADSIAAEAGALLDAALGASRIGRLAARLLWDPNETFELLVPALPPGRYPFVCAPHYSGKMTGALVVGRERPAEPGTPRLR